MSGAAGRDCSQAHSRRVWMSTAPHPCKGPLTPQGCGRDAEGQVDLLGLMLPGDLTADPTAGESGFIDQITPKTHSPHFAPSCHPLASALCEPVWPPRVPGVHSSVPWWRTLRGVPFVEEP